MTAPLTNDKIAALATPFGAAALAVIRTSGPDSVAAVARLTDRDTVVSATGGGRLRKVNILDPASGQVLDEVMLAIYREPRSYTGEEMVEIFCHGSPPGIQQILTLLYRQGFRAAEPGEFTQRAFLAGKLDLTRAEAVQEIVRSRTAQGHDLALRRLGGSVSAAIEEAKQRLVRLMAPVALQLDYPEEETGEIPFPVEPVRELREQLSTLAGSYRTGRLYQEGIVLVLAGRTNAGKSSLFNALLKEDRSIVSATPGTTRDYIESSLDLGGVPVRVYDTAGVRVTGEEIEGEGIRRTRQVLEAADLVLYLVDGTVGIDEEDREFLGRGTRLLPVWTKSDAPHCLPAPESFLPLSALTLAGLDRLVEEVLTRVTPEQTYPEGSPVIDSLRQKNLLEAASQSLLHVEEGLAAGVPIDAIALDLQEAIHALGEITGEVTSADILEQVFTGFCVGK